MGNARLGILLAAGLELAVGFAVLHDGRRGLGRHDLVGDLHVQIDRL
jgi:hypothetical protein